MLLRKSYTQTLSFIRLQRICGKMQLAANFCDIKIASNSRYCNNPFSAQLHFNCKITSSSCESCNFSWFSKSQGTHCWSQTLRMSASSSSLTMQQISWKISAHYHFAGFFCLQNITVHKFIDGARHLACSSLYLAPPPALTAVSGLFRTSSHQRLDTDICWCPHVTQGPRLWGVSEWWCRGLGSVSQILPLYWQRRGHQSRCDITTVAPSSGQLWGKGGKRYICVLCVTKPWFCFEASFIDKNDT